MATDPNLNKAKAPPLPPHITQTTHTPLRFSTTAHLPLPPTKILTFLHSSPSTLLNLHPYMTPCKTHTSTLTTPKAEITHETYEQSETYSFLPRWMPRRIARRCALQVKIVSEVVEKNEGEGGGSGGMVMNVVVDCAFGRTVLRMKWDVRDGEGKEGCSVVTEEVECVKAPFGGKGLAVRQARKAHGIIFGRLGEVMGCGVGEKVG